MIRIRKQICILCFFVTKIKAEIYYNVILYVNSNLIAEDLESEFDC